RLLFTSLYYKDFKLYCAMENKHEECEKALHIGFGVAKLVLKAAAVAAAFCLVKEVHKVHKAIEYYKEEK
ncbi:MAG: hypothetical protein K2G29_05270, partial [Muribaculaceae bacterium]|nr:hypothetical protein [Muribaculaceae bacterium]